MYQSNDPVESLKSICSCLYLVYTAKYVLFGNWLSDNLHIFSHYRNRVYMYTWKWQEKCEEYFGVF